MGVCVCACSCACARVCACVRVFVPPENEEQEGKPVCSGLFQLTLPQPLRKVATSGAISSEGMWHVSIAHWSEGALQPEACR